MSGYTVKWYSKIFDFTYESPAAGETVKEVVANFKNIHRNTARIISVQMSVPCQAILDEFDMGQKGFNSPIHR